MLQIAEREVAENAVLSHEAFPVLTAEVPEIASSIKQGESTGEAGIRVIHVQDTPSESYKNVGRNDPCPCGSGKKFKHCHGK